MMENLNAEQIVDILDKIDFFQGQRAGRELWTEKPFDIQEEDLKNFSLDVELLKTYIEELASETKLLIVELGNANSEILRLIEEKKELTDEKDTWEAIAKSYQKQFEDCGEDRAKLTEENERLRAENVDAQLGFRLLEDAFERLEKINEQIEADTVRKMQSEIKERCIKGGIYPAFVASTIDEIAKEMLEGDDARR